MLDIPARITLDHTGLEKSKHIGINYYINRCFICHAASYCYDHGSTVREHTTIVRLASVSLVYTSLEL